MPELRDVDPVLAQRIVRRLLHGSVTPVLGAGVNLCGRPEGFVWTPGCGHYPSGTELARELAAQCDFEGEDNRNLMAVATYAELSMGRAPLYDALRPVFDIDAPPTVVHDFIARAAHVRRDTAEGDAGAPLVVTTNYDVALERALGAVGETFDVVAYVAEGEARGRFRHVKPSGDVVVIDDPDGYDAIDLDRVVILKLHGTVDPADRHRDDFVITEEQYVEYLIADVGPAIPRVLRERLCSTHLLFLGYGLRDWNLLVVLTRMGVLPPQWNSWAIQLNAGRTEGQRWENRGIDKFDVDLVDFIGALEALLNAR